MPHDLLATFDTWHFHDKCIPLITWNSSWVHSLPCFKVVEHTAYRPICCSKPTCEKAANKTRCFLSFSTKLEQWGAGWGLDGRGFYGGGATGIRPLMLTGLGPLGGDTRITGGVRRRAGRREVNELPDSMVAPWALHCTYCHYYF